ncbi:MAG: hypothetical protein HC795_16400, partial [Coleofasciculaceae cyanobacterium RL_1_1]|nr:hypothetical protein [Coleofasciculaceae cyanobacterium RL_1_1]
MFLPLMTQFSLSLSFLAPLRQRLSRSMAKLIFVGGIMITVGVAIEVDKLARKREAAVMQQHLLQVQSSIERTLNQRLSILVALAALV